MTPPNITIDDTLLERLRVAAAAHGQDVNQYATALIAAGIERENTSRLFDAGAIYNDYAAKYDLPDLSHLSPEQLDDDTDRIVAVLDPARRAEMERQGLL